MSITAQIIKSDGAASGDGAVLGTQTIAAPANIDYIGPGMQVWVKQA